ncbi:hypothetical protein OGAPHI_000235 [Ogataea philodendri]|uniref:Uncharacterized protein n=1 Tax=Ogataea philodendri TaxID=1378263 RepID=A0A9P8PHT5_9ASCO|nr:uncharacterized protein OGAPHI_000235 [Ogataea philodendri]KAH3671532.1 hypothetical protein OGAPHI_000235 [Ogataea philodendri]
MRGITKMSSTWVGAMAPLNDLYENLCPSGTSGPTIGLRSLSLSFLATLMNTASFNSFMYSNSVSVKIDGPVNWIRGSPLASTLSNTSSQLVSFTRSC